MPMEQINNNGYQMFLDTDSVFAPQERAQERQAKQNALAAARQQQFDQRAVRNLLASSIDPATGMTNFQQAFMQAPTRFRPELQQLQQADLMAQAELSHKRGLGTKANLDAQGEYWKQQRDVAARLGDQSSWSTWRSTLPAEFQPIVPEQFSVENKRRTIATADDLLKTHFQQVDTSGGGYTLEMPEIGGGAATVVPGSQFTKTLSPDQIADNARENSAPDWTPEAIEGMAQLVAQGYQIPVPLGRGAKSDVVKNQIMTRAFEIQRGTKQPSKPGSAPAAAPAAAPAISAADAAANIGNARQDQQSRAASLRYYSSGRGNQIITSLNTAVDHLDTLSDLATALGNGDVGTFNRIGQAYKKEFGQDAPTNLDAAKVIIAREVLKAITASGGSVMEADELQSTMDKVRSPQQLAGVVDTLQKLLAGQLESVGTQYKITTNRTNFEERLSDRTKRVLGRGKDAGGVVQVITDADYNKLPSGTLFVDPNGEQRRKP